MGSTQTHPKPVRRSRSDASRPAQPSAGFTLIELLVVIAIIGMLAAVVTTGIGKAQAKAKLAKAETDLGTINSAIQSFKSEMGYYPAFKKRVDEEDMEEWNGFPELYENLCGERPPEGRGGRSSPYADLKVDNIMIYDEDADPFPYSPASRDDLEDPDMEKFYIDPWGLPYFYRENSQKKKQDWMVKHKSYDLWSAGPNGVNEACWGLDAREEEGYDDVSLW